MTFKPMWALKECGDEKEWEGHMIWQCFCVFSCKTFMIPPEPLCLHAKVLWMPENVMLTWERFVRGRETLRSRNNKSEQTTRMQDQH